MTKKFNDNEGSDKVSETVHLERLEERVLAIMSGSHSVFFTKGELAEILSLIGAKMKERNKKHVVIMQLVGTVVLTTIVYEKGFDPITSVAVVGGWCVFVSFFGKAIGMT